MKKMQQFPGTRNRERGAIAVVVAVAWTALFSMAVLAVDFGYLYAKRRGIQAAADVALHAAMPTWVANYPNGYSAATSKARAVANANNFSTSYGDTVTTSEDVPGNTFTVSITRTFPTFIGGVFGFAGKQVTGSATGKRTGGSTVAIHANDAAAGCAAQWAWGVGVQTTGNGILQINGDVEAQNKVELQATAGCTPATCFVSGIAKSPCAVYNDTGPQLSIPTTANVATPDPLAGTNLATLNAVCTGGTSVFTAMMGNPPTTLSGTCDLITPGVYCSNANIAVNPVFTTSFCPSNVTFISAGTIQIGGNGAITLTAAPGVPKNILAFSAYSGAGPAIQLANGIAGSFTLNGSIYAPNGQINLGTGTPGFTMTGSLVGDTVQIAMGPGQPWIFNSPGASGGTWSLYQ